MGSDNWLPSRLGDQADMYDNVDTKIDGYKVALGLTTGQVTAIKALCETFSAIYSWVEQCRLTTVGLVEWRDIVFKKGVAGAAVDDPPAFPPPTVPVGATQNVLAQFRDYRDIILASPGYTQAIGEDLHIVPTGGPSPSAPDTPPTLSVTAHSGYELTISGPMHGNDAMRIEWQRNGGDWVLVGFLTRTPGTFIITPHDAGSPESGNIRACYISNNAPNGDYSANYPVTVSA